MLKDAPFFLAYKLYLLHATNPSRWLWSVNRLRTHLSGYSPSPSFNVLNYQFLMYRFQFLTLFTSLTNKTSCLVWVRSLGPTVALSDSCRPLQGHNPHYNRSLRSDSISKLLKLLALALPESHQRVLCIVTGVLSCLTEHPAVSAVNTDTCSPNHPLMFVTWCVHLNFSDAFFN